MPRLARKNLESSFIHIIVQGIDRNYIFQNDSLKLAYKTLFKKNLESTNINIIAYCIMDNHVHILLHTENFKEVSKIMQKTNTAYAKLYNKIHQRVGYVFRDRYYVQMILNEVHLYNCIVYIHNNPINAGLVTHPKNYKFSSYNEYIKKFDIITSKSIQLVFGSNVNYLDSFIEIHKITTIDDIKDVVEDYVSSNTILTKFFKKNHTNLDAIKGNENLLGELLCNLRYQCRTIIKRYGEDFKNQ